MVQHRPDDPQWITARSCAAGNCVQIAFHEGSFLVGDTKDPNGPHLSFDADEWKTFLAGVKDGDFDDLGA